MGSRLTDPDVLEQLNISFAKAVTILIDVRSLEGQTASKLPRGDDGGLHHS